VSRDGFAPLPGGGELAFEIDGRAHAGTPLLLIRPLLGSMALWGVFRERLAGRVRVIAFDPRGEGRSSRAPLVVTTRAMADDAIALLDHLGVGRVHVFGISLGGMAAQWLALAAPARVARLCLASTTARGLDLLRGKLGRVAGLAWSAAGTRRTAAVSLLRGVLSTRFRRTHPADARRIEKPLRTEPARRVELLKHAVAGARHDLRDRMPGISAPTLVLAGGNDSLLGVEPQRRLAAAIPGATFELIADAGHDLTLEAPDETSKRVLDFLARR
jgi:3-oxoadipate enol-lactonase